MKLAVLFSGGKDSVFSAWMAKQKGHELSCLISVISENKDSYMYHPVEEKVVKLQSEAMGLPLLVKRSGGVKEKELKDLRDIISEAKEKFGVEGVCVGAIASNYQSERIKNICEELKLKVFSPIWGWSEEEYIHQLIENGFKVIIVKIAADGLDESWLGKEIDEKFVSEAKEKGIHVGGEGGEYESLVLGCPLFNKKLEIFDLKKKMSSEFCGVLVFGVKLI